MSALHLLIPSLSYRSTVALEAKHITTAQECPSPNAEFWWQGRGQMLMAANPR